MESENQEQETPIFKRVLLVSGAIFLLGLILSYFLFSYPVFPLLESLSESKLAKNKTIDLNNFSIIFKDKTYELLQEYYHEDLSVEMALCLKGEIDHDYIIRGIYQPEIVSQSYNHVSFRPCSNDTIILLHSQPFRHCIASEQDIITLNEVKARNPTTLMVIMCEPERFSVYR